jgi:hypothetical protein
MQPHFMVSCPTPMSTLKVIQHSVRVLDIQYVFESSAQPSARSINKEEAVKIAADWMATFYHGSLAVLRTWNSTKARSVLVCLPCGY